MIGSILGIVLQHEDGGLRPDGAMGDMIDEAAKSEVVISDHGDGGIVAFCETAGVIVWQIDSAEMWDGIDLHQGIEVLFEDLFPADILGIEVPADIGAAIVLGVAED